MFRKLTQPLMLALILAAAQPCAGVDPSLMGWWAFDGDATDSSGNGRHGTLHGDPQFVPGVFEQALEQDSDDYVTIDGYKGILGTNPFSIVAWVRTTNTAIGQIMHWGADVGGERVEFRINGNRLRISHGSGNVQGDTVLTDGEWYHVAVTVIANASASSGDVTFYVDGQDDTQVSSDPDAWNITVNSTLDVTIGYRPTRGDRPFIGNLDEIGLYDKVLTQEEIQQLMLAGGGKPFPFAMSPSPADGASLEAAWVNLSWSPGAFAVSHDVYIGENFDDVNDGTGDTFVGSQAGATLIVGFPGFPIETGLVPGTTYHWRIDEVNDADPNSPWKGPVWSFSIPPKNAYNLEPANGATFVDPNVALSWTGGFGARLHDVYFGDSFDDVNDAAPAAFKGQLTETTFTPGTLESGTTYYWRVDEFDGADTNRGDVVSLQTFPSVTIPVTDPNLVGWWKLDEGAGSVAVVDSSGHGHHGDVVGDSQWIAGYDGEALGLGGNSYVQMKDYEGVLGTHAFSASMWVRTSETAVQQLLWWGTQSGGQRVEFRVHSNGHIRMGAGNGQVEGSTDVTDGYWHHVAATVVDNATNSSSDIRIYVDGRDDTIEWTDTDPFDLTAGLEVAIGYRPSQGDRGLAGSVDDVRVYDKVLAQAEIEQIMRIEPLQAWGPGPRVGSTPDIVNALPLTWTPGDDASSHEVYFGTDADAVANADTSDATGINRGLQNATSFSPAEGVEWGGGPYYWRIDEVKADGTLTQGRVWAFAVADYLVVDNIESYNDLAEDDPASNRIYSAWIDGFGTTTNGAVVGNLDVPLTERNNVHGGSQAMPYAYDNNLKTSEATLTLTDRRDWTEHGVTRLSLWFRGDAANAAERMYVALNGNAVVYHKDAAVTQIANWTEWVIDLAEFGIDLTNVNTITIGFGTKNSPVAGGAGTMYFDDIWLVRP